MSEFDEFVFLLSDDQKAALMKGLQKAAETEVQEGVAAELESRQDEVPPRQTTVQGLTTVELYRPKPRPTVTVNKDFSVTRPDSKNGKQPVRAKRNQWKDTGENREEGFDPAKFEKMGKTERKRPEHVKVEIDCHLCGRSFKIDPDLIYGEFTRCNRCTG